MSDTQLREDPEIGTIKMYYKGWDVNDPVTNGNVWFKEINTRYCVPKSDFGDASKLY